MPYTTEFVEPEILFTHRGLPVYKTYRNDEFGEGARNFWFTLDPLHGTDSGCEFDVRDLPTWQPPEHPPFLCGAMTDQERIDREAAWKRYHADEIEENAIIAAITQALDHGDLAPHHCAVAWCNALVPKHNLGPDNRCPLCREGACTPWAPPPPGPPQPRERFTTQISCSVEASSETDATNRLAAAIRSAIPDVCFLPPDAQEFASTPTS